MDKWILSFTQSLITFVEDEMTSKYIWGGGGGCLYVESICKCKFDLLCVISVFLKIGKLACIPFHTICNIACKKRESKSYYR